jgi:2-phospho-L-lactate/phosphoenolpyruvate guanylyltransferase
MRTLAILPIKRFDAAKQRLADVLGTGSRQSLAQAMYRDVLGSLRRVEAIDAILVITADPMAEVTARSHRIKVLRDGQRGQSAATGTGLRYAAANGFDRALLVPGDVPLLDPVEVNAWLRENDADPVDLALVPDHHREGTNALLIEPPGTFSPSFGERSLQRHLDLARAAGLTYRVDPVESLLRDVDTPEDLAELWTALDGRRGLAPLTRGALRQLDRSRVNGSAEMARVRGRVREEDVSPWTDVPPWTSA